MKNQNGRIPFLYLSMITIFSVILIILNYVFGMIIPFRVEFLIGFVLALFIYVMWHSWITKGWLITFAMLLISFLTAFTAEALGVNFGLVFGKYHYTDALGVQVFGVPLLAALAWEPIIYASFHITDILAPSRNERSSKWFLKLPHYLWMSVIGAMATTAWDMMIDPIAVSEGWWVWHNGGEYLPYIANGVPVQNFIGWLGVSFNINLMYRLIAGTIPAQKKSVELSIYGPMMLYASLFLTSVGVTLTILKRPEVALIGLLVMGPFLAIAITNFNLIQRGFSTLLGAGWLEVEKSNGHIKTGQ